MPFQVPLWFSFLIAWILTAAAVKGIYVVKWRSENFANQLSNADEKFCNNVFAWLLAANCQKCESDIFNSVYRPFT